MSSRRRPEGRAPVIRDFDFLRPNKLSREHVRALTLVQETFTRGFSTQLASVLRCVSQMKVTSIEQRTWDEYVRSAPSPAFGILLNLAPLPGASMLLLPLDVSYTIVELLLGGGANVGGEHPNRALSEIETVLARGFIERILPELQVAFEPLETIRPSIFGIESNPQFAQIAGATDLVIACEFSVKIDAVESAASLCIPFSSLAGVLEDVASQGALANFQIDIDAARRKIAARTEDLDIDVSARFKQRTMRSSDILALEPGDILPLEMGTEEPLVLWAGNKPVQKVKLGRRGKRVAVEILEPVLLDNATANGTNRHQGGRR